MPSATSYSAAMMRKFSDATVRYAEKVIQRADANGNGNLTRAEANALGDIKDTFALYAEPGKTVKTEEFLAFYKGYVRINANRGELPVDLQDNIKNWIGLQGGTPISVRVEVEATCPEMVKSHRNGIVELDHSKGQSGDSVTLRFHGHQVTVHKYPGGFGTYDIGDKMPEGYAARLHEASGRDVKIEIVKDAVGTPSTREALDIVRAGFRDYILDVRAHERDWGSYYSTDWDVLVSDGIMEGINGFGTDTDDDLEISRGVNTYTFCGRGPFDLHTEVVFDKRTREVRYYIEID